MGMSPTEVDRQSMWQHAAAWNGYVAANSPDKGQLTERQAEELFEWIDSGASFQSACVMPSIEWNGGERSLTRLWWAP